MPFTAFPVKTPMIAAERAAAKPIRFIESEELLQAFYERLAITDAGIYDTIKQGDDLNPPDPTNPHAATTKLVIRNGDPSSYGLQARMEHFVNIRTISELSGLVAGVVSPNSGVEFGFVRADDVDWSASIFDTDAGIRAQAIDELMRVAVVGGRIGTEDWRRWTNEPLRGTALGAVESYFVRFSTFFSNFASKVGDTRRPFKEHPNETWKGITDGLGWYRFPRIIAANCRVWTRTGSASIIEDDDGSPPPFGQAWSDAVAAFDAASWIEGVFDSRFGYGFGRFHGTKTLYHDSPFPGKRRTESAISAVKVELHFDITDLGELPILDAKFTGRADAFLEVPEDGRFALSGLKIEETGSGIAANTGFTDDFRFGDATGLDFSGDELVITIVDLNDFDPGAVEPPDPDFPDQLGTEGGWDEGLNAVLRPNYISDVGFDESFLVQVVCQPQFDYL
jgi:hypothetical protein